MSFFNQIKVLNSAGTLVDSSNPFPVREWSFIDASNSTSTNLGAGGVFTGTATEIIQYGVVSVAVYSDVASATDGLQIQQSVDGTSDWHWVDTYTIAAGAAKTYQVQPVGDYLRIIYTNGATPTGDLHIHVVLHPDYIKPSSHRIQDAISTDDDAELVKAVITGKNPSGTFVNFQSTTAGNFKMSLEELESGVSSNSNTQLNVTPFHADGTEGILFSGTNYTTGKSGIDASTEAVICTDYSHHELHEGNHFFVEDVADLAINNVFDMQFTTPNTTKWANFSFELNCEAETMWYIYEGVSVILAGASVTPINNNRNSATTSTMTLNSITNSNTSNANADTDVSGALEIAHGIVGAGRSGGVVNRDREIILKQNTIYCMRAIASAAGYTNFNMQWYEHVDKN